MSTGIPFELIDEEEMKAIDAAFLAAAARSKSTHLSVSLVRQQHRIPDIEDIKKFHHPPKRSMCVTDITALEWCEKQFEFNFTHGKPKKTSAMQAGSARHTQLEMEVITRADVEIQSREDSWAVRVMNFIIGCRQLLTEGLTRELPVMGFVNGVWLTGIIDEMEITTTTDGMQQVNIIDTKTRLRPSLPSEAQKRNGRLQLMCYKWLWDEVSERGIPLNEFYDNFGLDPQKTLSESVRFHAAEACNEVAIQMLEDLMKVYAIECAGLNRASKSLKLRYEWQVDGSILGEEVFEYEKDWLEERIQWHLQFWNGFRQEASFVYPQERWKCQFCPFLQHCPTSSLPQS